MPQGSILGPALFCIYVLPLCDLLDSLGVFYHLYADVSMIFFVIEENIAVTTTKLNNLSNWFDGAKLKVNRDKTELMVIHSRRDNVKFPHCV